MKAGAMFNQKSAVCPGDFSYLALAARQLFSVVFIIASAGHFTSAAIASAAQQGVPMAALLVPVSGVIALAGGLSLLLGYHTKLGAWLLVVFLVPVTVLMHAFWAVSDPAMLSLQLTLFMRNLMMLGGALFVARVGGGSLSLDALLAEPKELDCEARTVIP
jgi:putative oxidoreductase